jgi:DNA replication licensing factor MCM6
LFNGRIYLNIPILFINSGFLLLTIMSSPFPRFPGSGIPATSPATSQHLYLPSSPNNTGNGGGSLPSQQPILDPLALDATTRERLAAQNGRGADEAEDEDMIPRRRRARMGEVTEYDDVPRVRDVTAEKVMESFGMFLEK